MRWWEKGERGDGGGGGEAGREHTCWEGRRDLGSQDQGVLEASDVA